MRKHIIQVMSRRGHDDITWDPEDEDSVEQARTLFNEHKEAGYTFYSGDRVDEFDPSLEKVTAVPPMAGG